jgi:sodium/hydrogen exchanger-like protein 6/7
MTVGLILRVTDDSIRDFVKFDYQIFFNLLLPPIILSSGYELHQANFFRNIGTILTFAFAGTFLSAVVIGVILWLYTRIPLEGLSMNWIDAISVGATLSATDPVTILAIFNSYKVDPKLYTIIFGESILNDAIAIVIFESAQKAKAGGGLTLGIVGLFKGIGIFLSDFFGSLIIGIIVGILAALGLKYTYVRRYPKIESCLIVLIAYATYFFSQAIGKSGMFLTVVCFLLGLWRLILGQPTRYCVVALLRNHAQALCLLQHVSTYTAYYQVPLPGAGAAVGELYLHLPGVVSVRG